VEKVMEGCISKAFQGDDALLRHDRERKKNTGHRLPRALPNRMHVKQKLSLMPVAVACSYDARKPETETRVDAD